MSGHKTRHTKTAAASSPAPSGSSNDEDGINHSPRMGRKEAEHKRRMIENQYYDELTTLLAMISERSVLKKMDKVTTLKEAVYCIRVYYDLAHRPTEAPPLPFLDPSPSKSTKSSTNPSPQESPSSKNLGAGKRLFSEGEMLNFFLDAHDSFLMVASEAGQILYTTELVTSLLGQMQSRLVGQNIYDYVHSSNRGTIRRLFVPLDDENCTKLPNSSILSFPPRHFTAQFKLHAGETSCNSHYLPFICLSFLRVWDQASNTKKSSSGDSRKACVIIIAKLPTSMTQVDLAVSTNDVNFEYDMRISREGRIIDVDKHAVMVFGFSTSELLGTLFFEYVDPYHIADVSDSMASFLTDGIGSTTPYRIRTKGGRSIWLISKGYLSYDPWNNKLNHILLTNRVLGCDQILPEHRFFQNTKHLPDPDGKDLYVANLETPVRTHSQVDLRSQMDPRPQMDSHTRMDPHPQSFLGTMDSNVFSFQSTADSSNMNPRNLDALSINPPAFPLQLPAAGVENMSQQTTFQHSLERLLHSADSDQRVGKSSGDLGVHSGGPRESSGLYSKEMLGTQRALPRMVGSGENGRDSGEPKLSVEERLMQYEQKLLEREQALNRQQMQFFKNAEKMMQQLSQAGGNMGAGGGGPNPMLEFMNKAMESMPAGPSTPLTTPSHPAMTQSREQGLLWDASQLGSERHSVSDQISSSHHTLQQHTQQTGLNVSASMYPNSQHPMFRPSQTTPMPEDGRYSSPTNCLPYSCHQSLDEHNVQFYQQQQALYSPFSAGGRSLPAANGGRSTAVPMGTRDTVLQGPNSMLSGRQFSLMGTEASKADEDFDLSDILSA